MKNSPEVNEGCGCLLIAVAIMVIVAAVIMIDHGDQLAEAVIGLIGRLP